MEIKHEEAEEEVPNSSLCTEENTDVFTKEGLCTCTTQSSAHAQPVCTPLLYSCFSQLTLLEMHKAILPTMDAEMLSSVNNSITYMTVDFNYATEVIS